MSASPSMKYNVEAFHIHTTPSQRDFKARRGCVSRARLVFGYLFINPSTLYGDYAEARGERERERERERVVTITVIFHVGYVVAGGYCRVGIFH